jgi:hypothetical protein
VGVSLESSHFCGDKAKNILLGGKYAAYPDLPRQAPFSESPAWQAKVESDPEFDIDHIANYWAVTANNNLAENGIAKMIA